MYVLMRKGVEKPLYVDPELARIVSLATIEQNVGKGDGLELYQYGRASNAPVRIDPIPTLGASVRRMCWVNLRMAVRVEGSLGNAPRPAEVKKATELLLKSAIMPHGDYKNYEIFDIQIIKDEPQKTDAGPGQPPSADAADQPKTGE